METCTSPKYQKKKDSAPCFFLKKNFYSSFLSLLYNIYINRYPIFYAVSLFAFFPIFNPFPSYVQSDFFPIIASSFSLSLFWCISLILFYVHRQNITQHWYIYKDFFLIFDPHINMIDKISWLALDVDGDDRKSGWSLKHCWNWYRFRYRKLDPARRMNFLLHAYWMVAEEIAMFQ